MEKANPAIKAIGAMVDQRQPGLSPEARAAEIIAVMAERGVHNSLLLRIKAALQDFVRNVLHIDLVLNDADVAAMIRRAAHSLEGGGTSGGVKQGFVGDLSPAFSRDEEKNKEMSFVSDFLSELSYEDAAFRYPISKSKTLEGNILDALPGAEYMGEDTRTDEREESKADHRYALHMPDKKTFYVYTRGNEVWIDVSRLQQGDQGSAIYHGVANYAYNTGKVFIGDPHGLSEDAVVRRTSAMLSSALRFGTTSHLSAADEQLKGFPDKGIEPLEWKGNDVAKTNALIHTYITTLQNKFPEIKSYKYDFGRLQFVDGRGRLVHADRFNMGAASKDARASRAGEASLRRGILIQSLASSESSERPGLLELVLNRSSQLVESNDSLKSVFSKNSAANQGLRYSTDSSESAAPASKFSTVKDWLKNQFAQHRGFMMGALTLDQISDIYGKTLEPVSEFAHIVEEMDTDKQKIADSADKIVEQWRKLPSAEADRLADVMHQATLMQYDPDKYDVFSDSHDPQRVEMYTQLTALSPEAKQLYRDARDQYKTTLEMVRDGLANRAERAGSLGGKVAAEIRLEFDKRALTGSGSCTTIRLATRRLPMPMSLQRLNLGSS